MDSHQNEFPGVHINCLFICIVAIPVLPGNLVLHLPIDFLVSNSLKNRGIQPLLWLLWRQSLYIVGVACPVGNYDNHIIDPNPFLLWVWLVPDLKSISCTVYFAGEACILQ